MKLYPCLCAPFQPPQNNETREKIWDERWKGGLDVAADALALAFLQHYFEASKFHGNDELVEQMRHKHDPRDARQIAHEHQDEIRPDWTEVRDDIMRAALYAKFEQNR